jgi:hypothetical protein
MKDSVIAILGIAVIAILITFLLVKKPLRENFWGLPGRTVKLDKEYRVNDKYQADMFSVPPTYQSMISPRFSNVDYGANILYNIPAKENLASPDFPLTFQGDVKEMYTPTSSVNDINTVGGVEKFAAAAQNGAFQTGEETTVMNAGSQMPSQIINYDRLIFANQRSRLYGRGDPIRGDLPIIPVNDGWFRPSVQPNIDLRQGAMNVIAGHDNSTANSLRALQAEFSGKTALSQKDISLGAAQADIIVTAFP